MNPTISIIIPTRNRPAALAVCLRALEGSEREILECIVCDDSSDHRTRDLLAAEFPRVRRIEGPHRGPGANRNLAARAAGGDWLIFIDDDCIPQSGFLEAYATTIDGMRDGAEAAVLSGRTIGSGGVEGSLLWEAPVYCGRGLPPSCNFAVDAEVFRSEGGFDERYRISFEDIEFFARLEAGGYCIRHLPTAVVEHPRRRIPGPSALAARWEARVISTLDFGATAREAVFPVLRHVAAVIVSRFRENPLRWDMLIAGGWFFLEWLLVAIRLPGWMRKWSGQPRSSFWAERAKAGLTPPRYGL
jgi:glycosyltransferase involved in cell wall biosynthesis